MPEEFGFVGIAIAVYLHAYLFITGMVSDEMTVGAVVVLHTIIRILVHLQQIFLLIDKNTLWHLWLNILLKNRKLQIFSLPPKCISLAY